LVVSRNLNIAAGATIVLVAAALFAVSLVLAPRRGMLGWRLLAGASRGGEVARAHQGYGG
ncbi:MAG TPA: hypothetical protein VGA45_05170, partial [Actinomycetota bacterium]